VIQNIEVSKLMVGWRFFLLN